MTQPHTSTAYHLTQNGERIILIPLEPPKVIVALPDRNSDALIIAEDARIHDALAAGNWFIVANLVAVAVADLPVVVPPGTPTAQVTFHAEAWVRNYAVGVDPEGPTTFEVPLADVEDRLRNDADLDVLATHPNAPRWVRRWAGPFRITVDDRQRD